MNHSVGVPNFPELDFGQIRKEGQDRKRRHKSIEKRKEGTWRGGAREGLGERNQKEEAWGGQHFSPTVCGRFSAWSSRSLPALVESVQPQVEVAALASGEAIGTIPGRIQPRSF